MSAAAHAALPHANPLSVVQVAELIEGMARTAPANALDVGSGPGSLAISLARAGAARVLGIDINEEFLRRANLTAAEHGLSDRVRFIHASPAELPAESYDAVLCVGASQAVGTPREALAWCRDRLSPGGHLFFAELTWRNRPDPEFLAFLGVEESFYWSEADEREALAAAGLQAYAITRATAEAWAAYEAGVHAGRLRFAAGLDPEDAAPLRRHAHAWKEAFDTHGSRCLGFGAYLATRAGV